MNVIEIYSDSTLSAAAETKFLMELIGKKNIVAVKVDLRKAPDLPGDADGRTGIEATIRPGLRESLGEVKLRIRGLTCGFSGTGPRCAIECLRALGVPANVISDETILEQMYVQRSLGSEYAPGNTLHEI